MQSGGKRRQPGIPAQRSVYIQVQTTSQDGLCLDSERSQTSQVDQRVATAAQVDGVTTTDGVDLLGGRIVGIKPRSLPLLLGQTRRRDRRHADEQRSQPSVGH